MGSYVSGRAALQDKIAEAFDIIPGACGVSIDTVMNTAVTEHTKYACVISFAGGDRRSREAFEQGAANRGRVWIWKAYCTLLARYEGNPEDIELETETSIDDIKGLLDGDPRLGNVVELARVTNIDTPEEVYINETPWKLVGFTVEFWDKA